MMIMCQLLIEFKYFEIYAMNYTKVLKSNQGLTHRPSVDVSVRTGLSLAFLKVKTH